MQASSQRAFSFTFLPSGWRFFAESFSFGGFLSMTALATAAPEPLQNRVWPTPMSAVEQPSASVRVRVAVKTPFP